MALTPETLVYLSRRLGSRAFLLALALSAPMPLAGLAVAADDVLPAAAPATKPTKSPATGPAVAAGYPVKLDRPYKVGDRTKVESVGAMKTTMKIRSENDVKDVKDGAGIRLDGVSEVKAVDANGHRTKVAFTVAECVLQVGGKSKELIPAGKVIEARWEKDQTKYAVDGKDVPDEAGELFDLVIELNDPDGVSDDLIFNTAGGQHRVGDSWAIDPAAGVKEFERIGLKTREEDLWGESVLEGVSKGAGDKAAAGKDASPSLQLSMKFKARALSGPGRRTDSKVKFVSGTLTAEATIALPVDPAAQSTHEVGKVLNTGKLATTDEAGNRLEIDRSTERQYDRTLTPAD